MSWLSSAIKGVGHAAGKVLSNPLVDAGLSFIPGVGPIAAGGAAALGNLIKPGGNIGSALKGGITTGGLGALGGLAGKIPGISSLEGAVGSLPGVSAVEGALSKIPGLQSIEGLLKGQNGQPGVLGELGSFLTGNGGKNALGLAQGVNAAMLQKQSSDYAKQAMGDVQNSYNERAPLRSAGIQGMLNPQTGANAAIAGLPQTGNPYARKPIPPVSPVPSAGGY